MPPALPGDGYLRKARIDLQTDIRFLRPTAIARARSDFHRFGTLHDLANPGGNECLAIASIHYPTADGQRADKGLPADGYLVLVKPNIFHGLPVDILRYKRDNYKFPQETTTDQFFSESQWESYYRLGARLGESITPEFLDMLSKPLDPLLFEADLPPTEETKPGALAADKDIALAAAAAVTAVREIPLRRAPRLRTGLGFTAVLAALLCGGWLWHQHDEGERKLSAGIRVDIRATERLYALASNEKCASLRQSFVDLADKWCDQPASRPELGKLEGRYEALVKGCGTVDQENCEKLKLWQTRSCYRGTGSAERPPMYWALPAAAPTDSADSMKCAPPQAEMLATTTELSGKTTSTGSRAPVQPGIVGLCQKQTVYIQVFGRDEVKKAEDSATIWLKDLQIKRPPIEDVLATAEKAGRKSPRVVSRDVIIYSTPEDEECASVLWARLGTDPLRRMQAPDLRATPGVIEVWLKPGS